MIVIARCAKRAVAIQLDCFVAEQTQLLAMTRGEFSSLRDATRREKGGHVFRQRGRKHVRQSRRPQIDFGAM